MTNSPRKSAGGRQAAAKAAKRVSRRQPGDVRRARNLSLSGEAIARGEAYSSARGTSLSALVEQFLRGLPAPADEDQPGLSPRERRRNALSAARAATSSPAVRELLGLLADTDLAATDARDIYRDHLWHKHGGR